jgi:hypothetical protein
MPVNYTRLGDGTLTIGSGPTAIECQVTSVTLVPENEVGDTVTTLCGDQVGGDVSTTYTLSGTLIVDPYTSGTSAFLWANAGSEQAFEFIPNTAAGLTVAGTLTPLKFDIGADEYGALLDSDFEWPVTGEPTVTWGTDPVA